MGLNWTKHLVRTGPDRGVSCSPRDHKLMPTLCLMVSVLTWCLLVLVLCLLPKRNGYFQVSASVIDPEGMSVVRSAFQLWL